MDFKERGLVEKIGVSVYTVEEAAAIIDKFDIDIIQPPFSIFDQRMANQGMFKRLKDKDVEIHIRSVFFTRFVINAKRE